MAEIARRLGEFPGAAVMQNYHPLVVHFPIALLTTATLVYLVAWIGRRHDWSRLGFWLLWFGVIGAGVAILTGLRAGAGVMVAPSVRTHILQQHERLMLGTGSSSLLLALWTLLDPPFPRRGRIVFIAGLIGMSILLAHGADYGAWMVYGYNAGGSLPQPIEFSN